MSCPLLPLHLSRHAIVHAGAGSPRFARESALLSQKQAREKLPCRYRAGYSAAGALLDRVVPLRVAVVLRVVALSWFLYILIALQRCCASNQRSGGRHGI